MHKKQLNNVVSLWVVISLSGVFYGVIPGEKAVSILFLEIPAQM
jgi:hypothetical protein